MNMLEKMIRKNETDKVLVIMSYVFNWFMIFTELLFFVSFSVTRVYAILPFVVCNLLLSSYAFILLKKGDLYHWTVIQYFICVDIMLAGVILLGFDYGFHLYSISMMAVSYFIKYVIKKRKNYRINPLVLSTVTVIAYFTCFFVHRKLGVFYVVNGFLKDFFFVYNSLVVFGLIVWYMYLFVTTILIKEDELERIALVDNLTGLYNRHYLLQKIDSRTRDELEGDWIAIIDIDNFKKVNDTYGHNAGDYVLQSVSSAVRDICDDCTVCRWGGEEFIIWSADSERDSSILEKVREKISETHLSYDDNDICVSVTVGTNVYSSEYSIDEWIDEADKKLYFGKNNGKNQVVY